MIRRGCRCPCPSRSRITSAGDGHTASIASDRAEGSRHDQRRVTPHSRLPDGPGREAIAGSAHRQGGGGHGPAQGCCLLRPPGALQRAAGAGRVERQRGDGARRRGRPALRQRHRAHPRRSSAGHPARRRRPRHHATPAGRLVGAAGARSLGAIRARAERASDGASGGHDPASVLRRAELARDAPVHATSRPRSRGPAHEGRGRPLMRVAIGLRLEANEDWEQAATYVTEAERLGVDFVWSHESWGLDAVTPLAFMAARTSRIRLGSGIMQAGTRTPALVAMTALSLASMSAGRFVLGMGVSGQQVIEGWHGLRFDRPVTRMREIVEIVRRAARGERVAFKGQVYELPLPGGEGKALRSSAKPRPDIPVYLATLSPRSLELTGEIADGWLGTSFMPDHPRILFDHLEVGAKHAGRTLGDLHLPAGGAVAFGDDVERLIAARKPGLAFTLGAMGSRQHNFYNDAFRRAGYVDAATEVQRLWLDGKRDEAAARVPDEIALKANLLGTEAMVRERLHV